MKSCGVGSKKRVVNEPIIVEGTHEAIVSKEDFELAQKVIRGGGPVSYTHLDVYKRQALPTPIDQFAKNYLGLRVSFARLSPDGSICGVTAYADTCLLYTSRCV